MSHMHDRYVRREMFTEALERAQKAEARVGELEKLVQDGNDRLLRAVDRNIALQEEIDASARRWTARVYEACTAKDREVARIVSWLRDKAANTVRDIQPADAREAEDCNLVSAALLDAAAAIERGEAGR